MGGGAREASSEVERAFLPLPVPGAMTRSERAPEVGVASQPMNSHCLNR